MATTKSLSEFVKPQAPRPTSYQVPVGVIHQPASNILHFAAASLLSRTVAGEGASDRDLGRARGQWGSRSRESCRDNEKGRSINGREEHVGLCRWGENRKHGAICSVRGLKSEQSWLLSCDLLALYTRFRERLFEFIVLMHGTE